VPPNPTTPFSQFRLQQYFLFRTQAFGVFVVSDPTLQAFGVHTATAGNLVQTRWVPVTSLQGTKIFWTTIRICPYVIALISFCIFFRFNVAKKMHRDLNASTVNSKLIVCHDPNKVGGINDGNG
jgi:hypothetical protein